MDEGADPKTLLAQLSEPPVHASREWFRKRGTLLEIVIEKVLKAEGMEPRIRFRPGGEEIDGSFILDDRAFLLEAKWRSDPTPASDLYAFKGKVDGKLVGTIGVFVTMNRYSPDAVEALQKGKELNLILFSADDFRFVVDGGCTFASAMKRKLRYAAEQGSPYLPLNPTAETAPPVAAAGSPDIPSGVTEFRRASPLAVGVTEEWNFIVEGLLDKEGILALFGKLLDERPVNIKFWVAEGASNVPKLTAEIAESTARQQVVVFVDGDASGRKAAKAVEGLGITTIFMDPFLEGWLMSAWPARQSSANREFQKRPADLRRLGRDANVERLRAKDPDFDALLRRMGFEHQ